MTDQKPMIPYAGPVAWDGERYVAMPEDADTHGALTADDIKALPTAHLTDDGDFVVAG